MQPDHPTPTPTEPPADAAASTAERRQTSRVHPKASPRNGSSGNQINDSRELLRKPCGPLCDSTIGQMLWRVTGAERRRTSRVRLRASPRNRSSGKPINNSQDLLRPRHEGLRVVAAALQSSLKQSGQAILSLGRSVRGGSSPLRHPVAVGLYPRSEFLILKRTRMHPRSALLPRQKTYTEMATARRTRRDTKRRKLDQTAVV